ncbi:MAG TPA: hypothetical protein DCK93_01315, partial [Blastocatellia bacterium]|nr:hypothetical protein [Blastocatellia bacterium]
ASNCISTQNLLTKQGRLMMAALFVVKSTFALFERIRIYAIRMAVHIFLETSFNHAESTS